MDPLPNIEMAFSLVLQHERQLNGAGNQAYVDNGLLTNNLAAIQMKKSSGSGNNDLYAFFVNVRAHH